MELTPITAHGATALDTIARDCGAVTVGCSDVAGIVQAVIDSRARVRAEHDTLLETVAALEADEKQIADACDESRVLSRRAIERLGARFEGIRRADKPAVDCTVRDSACYSIVVPEWPRVKKHLARLLDRE